MPLDLVFERRLTGKRAVLSVAARIKVVNRTVQLKRRFLLGLHAS